MKKTLIRIALGLLVLLIIAVIASGLFLDGAVKRGVETIGPKLTQVSVQLDGVSLSLLGGSGKITGLVIGNPEGFQTSQAIKVGTASVALKPTSLLADKLIIKSINVQAPDITFEGGLGGNNLSKILANLEAATGGGDTNAATNPEAASAGKKLQVDDFIISGGKVHLHLTDLGGRAVTVPIPDIHLTKLGAGPEGITAAELTRQALIAIEREAVKAASKSLGDLGKGAAELTKGAGRTALGAATNLTEGMGGLFRKRESTP